MFYRVAVQWCQCCSDAAEFEPWLLSRHYSFELDSLDSSEEQYLRAEFIFIIFNSLFYKR